MGQPVEWKQGVSLECGGDAEKLGLYALVPNWNFETEFWVKQKSSFIVMPTKGGYSWLLPLKIVCPNPAGFGEETL